MNGKLRKQVLRAFKRLGNDFINEELLKWVRGQEIELDDNADMMLILYWFWNWIGTNNYDPDNIKELEFAVFHFIMMWMVYLEESESDREEFNKKCDRALEVLRRKKLGNQTL